MNVLLSTTVKTIPNPDTVSPGFAGFVVVFLLAVATVVLIRSMVKHLRNVTYAAGEQPKNETVPVPPADRRR
jgi:hypothetical protein